MQETRPRELSDEEAKRQGKLRREYFADTPNGIKAMGDRLAELEGQGETLVRRQRKIGRNDPCPCGSGKKFKKCCLSGLR